MTLTQTPKPVMLVVDDDPDVLRAVARDLRARYSADYRVLRAESGEEALDALKEVRERGDPVALLLSDQRMPGLDGVAFLSRAAALFPGAKRALLTAYADTDAAIRAINESQVHFYLTKPWDPPQEQLYPVLDDLLDDWRGEFKPGYGGLKIVGDRWSPRSHDLRDFLARNGVPYTFYDLETNDEAQELLGDEGGEALPLVILPGGERLADPDPAAVAEAVGLSRPASRPFYDLAIVGGGPAGLAAAVYGASEGLSTLLIEREAPGGQAGTSSRIENYLGFPAGLSGGDLARRAVAQAQKFGVDLLTPRDVTSLRVEGPYKVLEVAGEGEISAHAVVIATGVSWQKLPAQGAEALTGRGVYYGAARSEAVDCAGENVYIVGAGNSAGQAAMYFSQAAAQVTMLVRGASLEARMSQYLVDQIRKTPNIGVLTRHEVMAVHGEERLEKLTLKNCETGEERTVPTHFLFSFIGAAPHTGWLDGVVARDARGFLRVGDQLREDDLRGWPLERAPFPLETNVPGIFAVGDVRSTSVKRVASAVGEGSVTVSFVHQHLAGL
ncbi:response regulator [Deinococcus hopiensis]|uniref:Thioredoxin reductase (NADPH) n=1 Tax=Deinococcus hopiensis KR-140 TaxID=695939 RepID=A0A1W1UG45_9DEIO|nr:response regulator [Deinococcus hopiensis]SMB80075.1 thioredoxin reductase (NADPH) [Deinococcus hopiensis KR-140]